MNVRSVFLIAVAIMAGPVALSPTAPTQHPRTARKTVFSKLKVGQSVTLKDKGRLFEISTLDEIAPLSHTVIEVGEDYIVLRDESKITEIRIPVTAISAVIHVTTKPQK